MGTVLSSKLECGSHAFSIVETASMKIEALIPFIRFL